MEIVVATLRGLHVATLMSLFGSLVFLMFVALPVTTEGAEDTPHLWQRLRYLARASAALALLIGVAWLVVEASVIAGTDSVTTTLHVLPMVALRTQFGQWLLLRLALILGFLLILRSRRDSVVIGTLLAAASLATQPMLGHAGAIGGSVGATLIISEIIHVLAAGAWLGGLLPLFITIGVLSHGSAAITCQNFTAVGLSAVLLLCGTAIVQVVEFMGGLAGLFGTGYGQIALVKLALFAVLLVLAGLNRFALTERLAETTGSAARRYLRASIAFEIVLGTMVVVTAGFLASHTPGIHQQPVWPFAWRLSFDAMAEPDLRREVIGGLIAVGAGCIAGVVALLWHRGRWLAAFAAIAAFLVAKPHLDLLFVPAYPTSYFTSPTEFAATAIAHGEKLFATNCAMCHGPDGRGDGPASKAQPTPPADLTAAHLWSHSDGDLFWFISHGIDAPDGTISMPGFERTLSSEARWDLIDYLRAHNAGVSVRTTGKWSHSVPVPQFDVTCPTGRTIDFDDLRGRVVRIVAASDGEATMPVPPFGTDVTTVILARKSAPASNTVACMASEPETWTAFAILSGVTSPTLAGEQVLVDQNGWLRAMWPSRISTELPNPHALADTIHDIVTHPVTADAAGAHVHRH